MPQSIAIIAPSSVPFQIGGAEKLWWGLHQALSEFSDNAVELVKLPCKENSFTDLVNSYKMFSELDLSHFDMIISTKYPAWMVEHKNHVVYMMHTLRGLYDTYQLTYLPETLFSIPAPLHDLMSLIRKEHPSRDDLQESFVLIHRALETKSLPSFFFSFPGALIREIVHFFDKVALAPTQIAAYAAISARVRDRADYFPKGVDVKVLYPSSNITDFFTAPGEYIFTASRLNSTKRLDMIIRAMKYVQADIPLKIAGTGQDREYLQQLAANDHRISFLGYVPDSSLPELYSKALFVPFVPYDEDYGFITIEAMQAGKPVVTVSDSGGVCEFVEDGVTGLCTDPTPEALGAAMQRLVNSPELARKMGAVAKERVQDITWKNTVEKLLDHVAKSGLHHLQGTRTKILVCCTFSADKNGTGGQRRLYHLCRILAKDFFVLLICLGKQSQRHTDLKEILPYFQQLTLPWTAETLESSEHFTQILGTRSDDLALMQSCTKYTPLLETLRTQGKDAACVILSHPFLYPAVQQTLPNLPVFYDAQDVEVDIKAVILDKKFPDLLQEVFDVEKKLCLDAQYIFPCSEENKKRFIELYTVPSSRFHCFANGFDDSSVHFVTPSERHKLRKKLEYPDAKLALFIGSGHRPNAEAVLHIIQIAHSLPKIQFLIVGSVDGQPMVKSAHLPENVHLTGVVSELVKNRLLYVADVGLNPITSGSGTNLKILEYMVAGLESVTTPFGLRGVKREDFSAVHCCEINDFAQEIQHILDKPSKEKELSALSEYTVKHYSWDGIMQELNDIMQSVVKSGDHECA